MKKALLVLGGVLLVVVSTQSAAVIPMQNDAMSVESQRAIVDQYCTRCHNDKLKSGSFSWTELDLTHPEANVVRAEKIIRKIRSGMMPPAGAPRPELAKLKSFASGLELRVDQAALKQIGRPHV